MSDRELLELAAKAAGAVDTRAIRNGWEGFLYIQVLWAEDGHFEDWNPLTDDGDALRLAVSLKIGVQMDDMYAFGIIDQDSGCGMCECLGDDPNAATRRAVVRAAAEIGRTK